MKRLKIYVLLCLVAALSSCMDMYLPPKNTLTDDDLLSTSSGMKVYMARMYSQMPWEDFKYSSKRGLSEKNSYLTGLGLDATGEAVDRNDMTRVFNGEGGNWWSSAFTLIRDANKLIENLPAYQGSYPEVDYNDYLGQAYFVRAYSFYQMARRYGGIPLVTKVIAYPAESDQLEMYRSSEEETWDQIAADFDKAAELMKPASSVRGYANRYVALAFKAEAMLYAGSVAKYNSEPGANIPAMTGKKSGKTVIGFTDGAAASKKYFAQAYAAAREVMKSKRYSLYLTSWAENNPEAQYKNMVNMFSDLNSTENILVREYEYPTLTHGIDAYSSPYLWHAPLSGGNCPTLDFVEMFDGIEKHPDGTIKVTTGNTNAEGEYLLFDSPYDLFANAEPRLRAYVIFPMDVFRNTEIEVRTGIYTGGSEGHVPLLHKDYSFSTAFTRYPELEAYTSKTDKTLYLGMKPTSGIDVVEVNGKEMQATGSCGPFMEDGEATITGFHLRKYMDPDKTLAEVGEGKSDQPFVLIRYADVLLAAAEAGVELSIAGEPSPVEGDDMLAVATQAIRDIRSRAGADPLVSDLGADNASRNIVRRERLKELAFENKAKWDLRRWRVQHQENRSLFFGVEKDASLFSNNEQYCFRGLYPFYSTENDKYFFDAHFVNGKHNTASYEQHLKFTYTVLDYYFEIPSGEVAKSQYIDQQPNRY